MTLTKLKLHSHFLKSSAKIPTIAWRVCLFSEASILQWGIEKNNLYPQTLIESYVQLQLYFA